MGELPAARMARAGLAVALAAIAVLGAGCGSGGGEAVEGPVTVYVSLPLTGPEGSAGGDAADGARLALEDAGGRAGELEVRARYLDDARGRGWDPVAVGENARAAVQDSSAAAYIGELASEPTRASAPITNQAGIAQISPGASAIDLTGPAEGYPDTPGRYRPSGEATFARVVPSDGEQVGALAEWAGEKGVGRLAGRSDGSPFGNLMLSEFTADAGEVGVQVAGGRERGVGTGTSFVAGGGPFGPGVLTVSSARGAASGAVVAGELPDAAFARGFRARFGREPGPYAAYGYEAMRVALEAIGKADRQGGFRASIVAGILGSEHPDSILGGYSITEEGDSTLCAVQRYLLEPLRPERAVCP